MFLKLHELARDRRRLLTAAFICWAALTLLLAHSAITVGHDSKSSHHGGQSEMVVVVVCLATLVAGVWFAAARWLHSHRPRLALPLPYTAIAVVAYIETGPDPPGPPTPYQLQVLLR